MDVIKTLLGVIIICLSANIFASSKQQQNKIQFSITGNDRYFVNSNDKYCAQVLFDQNKTYRLMTPKGETSGTYSYKEGFLKTFEKGTNLFNLKYESHKQNGDTVASIFNDLDLKDKKMIISAKACKNIGFKIFELPSTDFLNKERNVATLEPKLQPIELIGSIDDLKLETDPIGKTYYVYTNSCELSNPSSIILKCLLRGGKTSFAMITTTKENAKNLLKNLGAYRRRLTCNIEGFSGDTITCKGILTTYEDTDFWP